MNEDFVAAVKSRVLDAVQRGMTEFVESRREAIKEGLSVPVEYAGSRIIRSAPGEDPRLETGILQNSVQSYVEANPDGNVIGIIFTDELKAIWLNFGTTNIDPRPFWDRAEQDVRDNADELLRMIAQNFGTASPTYAAPL